MVYIYRNVKLGTKPYRPICLSSPAKIGDILYLPVSRGTPGAVISAGKKPCSHRKYRPEFSVKVDDINLSGDLFLSFWG